MGNGRSLLYDVLIHGPRTTYILMPMLGMPLFVGLCPIRYTTSCRKNSDSTSHRRRATIVVVLPHTPAVVFHVVLASGSFSEQSFRFPSLVYLFVWVIP